MGLNVIAKAFPRVRIVTSMVDPVLSKETLFIEPGIGNFGGKWGDIQLNHVKTELNIGLIL